MKQYLPNRFELLAFICGFTLMTFEMASARILAPAVGSSTYVWTSVIGVIIAALSFGFYLGGRVADVRHNERDIVWLLLGVAGLMSLTVILYPTALPWFAASPMDVRIQAVAAAIILFAPTSLVLGMISPYLAKLNVISLKTTGAAVANLSMWDAVGGIVGTFLTGFFLFGYIGSRAIFIFVIVVVVASVAILRQRLSVGQWLYAVVLLGLTLLAPVQSKVVNIDTPSAHYTVFEWQQEQRRLRGLATGPGGVQSGVDIQRPYEPVFWYTREIAGVIDATAKRGNVLMLGGGSFTLPQQMALRYPGSQVDVVEIDPQLAAVAREYFFYQDPKNVRMIFEDARAFSSRATSQYDIVVVDIYGDTDVPFTFMTAEYGAALKNLVKPDGIVVTNMIASPVGSCRDLLTALEAPYRQNFRHRAIKVDRSRANSKAPRNIIGVYGNDRLKYEGFTDMSVPAAEPYTDNFTPAERLRQQCLA